VSQRFLSALKKIPPIAQRRFHAAFGFILLGLITPLSADWREVAGFTRLQLIAASDLVSSAPSQGLTQVEASTTVPPPYTFLPDTANSLFSGKTFTNKSAATGTAISSHATHVATNFYGNTTSLISGNCPVDVYYVDDWLYTKFLNYGANLYPAVESRAVQNHSWAASTTNGITDSIATQINERVDFAINRDGFVCVVGSDNLESTVLPQLLCQSYHTISVGRDDGGHSAGFTNLDVTGRIKPDIVAPSADPEYASSWTTPMVASAASLLYAKLPTSPALLVPDKPRVIKALLLATATKTPAWANTTARPLDLKYGAGILNIYHAYNALRAGRATASTSVLQKSRGWGAETVNGNSTTTYFFTIAPGAPSTPFSAALTWHRVVSKSGGGTWSATPLPNLNLHLYRATGFTVGTLVAESLSTVDNVELVYQPALTPGSYALVVQNTSATATPYAVAWHSLPAVNLAATVPIAREIDLQAGVVTISRTGDTTLPLFVPLTVSGTAVAGSDYLTLPAGVTIPTGQASTTLQVVPVGDFLAQGNRSVSVAVAADFALVSDVTQPAVVTIQDKPFDAWRFANFSGPELANASISAEKADPDGDALPNLVEYALGFDPRIAGISPVTTSQSGGYLTLSSSKNTAATDISWNAEVTADLQDWQATVVITNTTTSFVARDSVLAANAAERFIRLKITRP